MGIKPIKVAQLNSYINRVLNLDPILGNVSVVGEISNLKFHGSGHVYFSLKDDTSTVRCFIAASNVMKINCPIEEGMEVIATGYIAVYERGGYYSLNVRELETNGIGQLAVQFQKLKDKLSREGLFDETHKKAIPAFASKIAVVTSETGAAIRDIIRTIKNKNTYTDILVYPVLVQGPAAAGEISSAIDDLNANHKDVDVIITGRGGGSMEELWAFNEEIVARSIYNSKIPVISAVGHETDFTIADFVADLRAATPTAAAEAAAFDTFEMLNYLEEVKTNLKNSLLSIAEIKKNRLESLNPSVFESVLRSRITYEQMNADSIIEKMESDIKTKLSALRDKIEHEREVLEAANPKSIFARGYSVIRDNNGKIINTTADLNIGNTISIETFDGNAKAKITEL